MTIYGGAIPPNQSTFDGTIGVDFTVNHTGNSTGAWWFRASASAVAQVTIGIYKTLPSGAVQLVSKNVSGMVAGQWNFIAWNAPVALTPGEIYTVAAYTHGGSIAFSSNTFNNAYVYNTPFSAMHGRANGSSSLIFPSGIFNDGYGVDVEFVETAPCAPCPPCPPVGDGPCHSISGVDPVKQVRDAILACASTSVDHTGDLELRRVCAVPGDIAWDDCGCGQLVITENRRYGSRIFPTEGPDLDAECGEPVLVVDFTLSITRCVPGMDDAGNPPDCSLLSIAADQLSKDKRDMRSGVMCCLTTMYDANTVPVIGFIIQAQETIGPSGGCAGSELNFLVGFPNPCGC